MPLVSILRGCFLAQAMQVVTPGRASSRASGIGSPHKAQRLRVRFISSVVVMVAHLLFIPGDAQPVPRDGARGPCHFNFFNSSAVQGSWRCSVALRTSAT